MAKFKYSESANLERCRVALNNATDQSSIKRALGDYGYTEDTLQQGLELHALARQAYHFNKQEDDQTGAASEDFKLRRAKLKQLQRRHRNKVKVAFKRDPLTLQKLGASGSMPNAYSDWLMAVEKFYTDIIEDKIVLEKLARLKFTAVDAEAALEDVLSLKEARERYVREVGESQQATIDKDKALDALEEWMDDFEDTAKIALEDQPQLLEALKITVKR